MVVVGDVIGERRDLRFDAGERVQAKVDHLVELLNRFRKKFALRLRTRERSVVLDDSLQRLPGQVQPVELGIAGFELRDEAKRMGVVVKATVRRHRSRKRVLACMPERGVAQVMRQRQRLGEILINKQHA